MIAPDIFLSYNREDAATAKRFADAFAAEGLSVWWDATLRSGEAYDEVTEAALRGAKAVVVLWSPRSVASRWVRAEATIADRCKTLVPVTIEPCERPIMFELTQTAELSHWTGDAGDRAWLAFLSDVKRFVTKAAPSPMAMPVTQSTPAQTIQKGARPSLAVLPFTNRSGLREDDIFAIGMVEDIIDALSLSRTLKILASGSTAAFRKNAIDVAEIGRSLGVRYLMEGNIRRVGEALRVSTQLIEAASGAILWTEKFDRPLAELAVLQEELVLEVATHLGSQIHRLEVERALKKPSNITAYEARIRSAVATTRGDWKTALAEAERAVAMAPDDGGSHACLAFALSGEIVFGSDDPQWWPRVQAHIAKALALDPGRAYVQLWVGWSFAWSGFPEQGLAYVEGAVALNPNNSTARHGRGAVYFCLGRLDDAIEEFRAVEALSPNSPSLYNLLGMQALVNFAMGHTERAKADLDQSLRLMPNFITALLLRPCLAMLEDDHTAARASITALRAAHPGMDRARCLRMISVKAYQLNPAMKTLATAFAAAWDATPGEGSE